jgi:hypothetical protein
MARTRIREAEGTLSGQALARWALILGLLVGPSYGAYYLATYAAVSQQAEGFARQWLDVLCQGNVEKGFWMTMPLPRSDKPPSREEIEAIYNFQLDQTMKGPFTHFSQSELVRLLGQGGKDTKVVSEGVGSWTYEGGGYNVQVSFSIESPLAKFKVAVSLHGASSPDRKWTGRQWRVIPDPASTGLVRSEPVQWTPAGQDQQALATGAKGYADSWVRQWTAKDWDGAYLATVPGPDRKPLDSAARQAWIGGLAAGWPATNKPAERKALAERAPYTEGALVSAREGGFWASDVEVGQTGMKLRDYAQLRIRQAFGLPTPETVRFTFNPNATPQPVIEKLEKGWLFGCDLQIFVAPAGSKEAPVIVDALLMVEAIPTGPKEATLRITELRLVRARLAPPPQAGRGR